MQEVRKELIAIRDKVNTLLDAIDGNPKRGKAAGVEPPTAAKVSSSGVAVESTAKAGTLPGQGVHLVGVFTRPV